MNQCHLCFLHCQALRDLTGCMHRNTLHALVISFAVATKTSIWLMKSFVVFEVKGCYQWGPEESDNSPLPGVMPVVGRYFCSFVFCHSWGTILLLIVCHWNSLDEIALANIVWVQLGVFDYLPSKLAAFWIRCTPRTKLYEDVFTAILQFISIKDMSSWQTI